MIDDVVHRYLSEQHMVFRVHWHSMWGVVGLGLVVRIEDIVGHSVMKVYQFSL